MRHAYMYTGAYESNYSGLKAGANSYSTTDGSKAEIKWPDKIDGVRVSYMEKSGKKFYAVRVQHGAHDIVLVFLVFFVLVCFLFFWWLSSVALSVTDDEASALLDDIIRENPDKQRELATMISEINIARRAARSQTGQS